MTMPGETIATGASNVCPDCGVKLENAVHYSNAYYIGTWCECGPYSRESGYYKTREEAEKTLASDTFTR